jgi:farnesyl-diphosphate farnesyltransferase
MTMPLTDHQWLRVLQGVSRSFYLSLRLLPTPMRRGAALAYLLARASDTLADTNGVAMTVRLDSLEKFRQALARRGSTMPNGLAYEGHFEIPAERWLIQRLGDVWDACCRLPDLEWEAIQNVLNTIVGGQQLDLIRFSSADRDHPVALASREELRDYTYRVAGCVGEFWTHLGFLTLRGDYSQSDPATLSTWGKTYGMGLQLVNILRDLPQDLEAGRCYLPVANPKDPEELRMEYHYWLSVAADQVTDGQRYAEQLARKRLRVASGLPASIAISTIDLLKAADEQALQGRIKVPRRTVYRALARGLIVG